MKTIQEIIKDLGPEWENEANERYTPTSDEDGGKEYEAFLRDIHTIYKTLTWYKQ